MLPLLWQTVITAVRQGSTGYAQYMTAFNHNFGGSSGGGGGGDGSGCLIAIAVVVVLVLIAMGG